MRDYDQQFPGVINPELLSDDCDYNLSFAKTILEGTLAKSSASDDSQTEGAEIGNEDRSEIVWPQVEWDVATSKFVEIKPERQLIKPDEHVIPPTIGIRNLPGEEGAEATITAQL